MESGVVWLRDDNLYIGCAENIYAYIEKVYDSLEKKHDIIVGDDAWKEKYISIKELYNPCTKKNYDSCVNNDAWRER